MLSFLMKCASLGQRLSKGAVGHLVPANDILQWSWGFPNLDFIWAVRMRMTV